MCKKIVAIYEQLVVNKKLYMCNDGGNRHKHYGFYNTPLFNNTPTSPWPTRGYFHYDIKTQVSLHSEQTNRLFYENLNILQNYTDNKCARPFYESLTYSDDNMTRHFIYQMIFLISKHVHYLVS